MLDGLGPSDLALVIEDLLGRIAVADGTLIEAGFATLSALQNSGNCDNAVTVSAGTFGIVFSLAMDPSKHPENGPSI